MENPRVGRPTVLVVDGHDDTLELYKTALPELGFSVVAARDASEAYRCACCTRPDLIVTEIVLPRHDGWQLIARVRNDPRLRDTPIMVVTTVDHAEVRSRAANQGCSGFFVKPRLPDDLAASFRQVLANAK
jgi:CheY-like chemotaxis protein